MRKWILLAMPLILAACGKKLPVAGPEDLPGGVARRALVEVFTATWCTNCATSDQAAEALEAELGDSVTLIEYHPTFGVPQDPFGTAQIDQRFSYYGVSAPPVFICDGVAKVSGAVPNLLSEYRSAAAGRLQKKSPVSVSLSGGLGSNAAAYSLTVRSEVDENLDGLRLLLVLAEDSVSYSAPNGITLHRQVARRLSPDHPGEAFSLAARSQIARNGSITVDPAWAQERLNLTAVVQDGSTGEVLQSARMKLFQASYSLQIAAPDTLLDGAAFATVAFPFTVHNTGNVGDSVIIDLPQGQMVPDTLVATVCDRYSCYSVPFSRYLASGDSLAGLEVHIIPYGSGRSTAVLTATLQSSQSNGAAARFHAEVP